MNSTDEDLERLRPSREELNALREEVERLEASLAAARSRVNEAEHRAENLEHERDLARIQRDSALADVVKWKDSYLGAQEDIALAGAALETRDAEVARLRGLLSAVAFESGEWNNPAEEAWYAAVRAEGINGSTPEATTPAVPGRLAEAEGLLRRWQRDDVEHDFDVRELTRAFLTTQPEPSASLPFTPPSPDECPACAKVARHPGEGYGCAWHSSPSASPVSAAPTKEHP